MAFLNRIILAALSGLALTGCFSDFEPDIESTPVLCLNSLIVAGEPVEVSLTHTWRWSEGSPVDGYDISVNDAEVSLIVNGEFVENLKSVEKQEPDYGMPFYSTPVQYESHYAPVSGDHVQLRAVSPTYGEAFAEVTVPQPVPIDKVEVSVRDFYDYSQTWTGNYQMSLAFRVWFADPGDATDYYIFDAGTSPGIFSDAPGGERNMAYVQGCWFDFSGEPLFTEHVSALESVFSDTSGYTIFTDRQISGKSYPLTISTDNVDFIYYNPGNDPELKDFSIDLTLGSISDSYYYHVLSVWVANDGIPGMLGGVGLGEPVYATSNVSTGAGVVAAVARSTRRVKLLDIVEQQTGVSLR